VPLEGVASVGTQVRILDNPVLSDVTALLGAQVGEMGSIEIIQNPMLPPCDAEMLASAWQPPGFVGNVEVHTNLGTCP
jgi:hypothetical protein